MGATNSNSGDPLGVIKNFKWFKTESKKKLRHSISISIVSLLLKHHQQNKVDVHFLIVKNAYLHEPHTPPHPILREGSSKWQGSKYLFQQVVVGQVAAVEPELEGFGEGLLGPLLRSPVGPSAGQEGELIFPEESRHRLPQLKHEFNHHKVVVVA